MWKQILPREHGTWAMLLVPFAIGVGVARRFGGREALLLVAVLALFLAETQLMALARLDAAGRPDREARRRLCAALAVCLALGVGAGLALVVACHLVALVAFGALGALLVGAALVLVRQRADRGPAAQGLAALGLTLTAPAALYVARGVLDAAALELWILNALFFLGGVFDVQLKIDTLRLRGGLHAVSERLAFASRTLAIDVALLLTALATLAHGPLRPVAAVAFAPVAVQAVVGALRLDRPARLKRVGLLSTAHSLLFAALLIWLG